MLYDTGNLYEVDEVSFILFFSLQSIYLAIDFNYVVHNTSSTQLWSTAATPKIAHIGLLLVYVSQLMFKINKITTHAIYVMTKYGFSGAVSDDCNGL